MRMLLAAGVMAATAPQLTIAVVVIQTSGDVVRCFCQVDAAHR